MSRDSQGSSLPRCFIVWLTGTAVSVVVPVVLRGDLVRAARLSGGLDAVAFDEVLTSSCAVAVTVCAAWFWLALTVVTAEAASGRIRAVPGCPAALRRGVLLACGAGLLLAPAPAIADGAAGRAPAPAEPPYVLTGLPLPDRPSGPAPTDTRVRVRAGDSLWSIAAASLPRGAGDRAIDAYWRRIWQANRPLVGADPDLIEPGIQLHLPDRKDR